MVSRPCARSFDRGFSSFAVKTGGTALRSSPVTMVPPQDPRPSTPPFESRPEGGSLQEASDRRRHRRRHPQGKVRLTVEPTTITGDVDNLSRSGILFYADGSLQVTLEIEEDGQKTTRKGRIVRAQRIRGTTFGWAIEFDA